MLTFVKNSAKFKHMLYKNRIIKFQNTENSFLFGVRGSGKTALLRRLFPSALYIDLLNETRYQSYLSKIGLFYEEVSNSSNDGLVIVDEIQKMPQLLNEVHRLIESSNRRFILTGSSAKKIRAKGVNLLGGRAGIKALHPFTPEELGEDFNLEQALQYGLLPIVYSAPDQSSKLRNYVETYLKEEIKAEALVRNLPSFARFLKIAGLYHGQVVNRKAFASEAEIPQRSVNDFFSILEDTLLGFFLPAYTPKLKLREQKKPKFYLIDPGIARALKGHFGPVSVNEKGFLFEGLIAQILRAYKDYNKLCKDIFYWSSLESKQTEVDFILEREEGLIAIEVKAKEQVFAKDSKGLKALSQLDSVKRRIIVYMGKTIRKTKEGIEIWPFDFFCKNLKEDFKSVVVYGDKKPKPVLFTEESFLKPEFNPSDLQIPPPDDVMKFEKPYPKETIKTKRIAWAPVDGMQFEKLCLDLYRSKFGDQTQKYGRQGQIQKGVDIIVPDKNIGIQCKKRACNGKITEKELRQEVKKAKQFKPALKRFILATTCPRDEKIQEIASLISEEHKEEKRFSVQIHSWDDIKELLDQYPTVYNKYYLQTQIPDTKPTLIKAIQSESRHQELNRIRDLLNKNQPKTALKLLEDFEKDKWDQLGNKEKYKLLTNKASALIEMKKEQESSALTIKALQFNIEDEDANFNCALAYFIRNDIEKTKKYIKIVKNLNPININAFILEIQIKDREQKDFKEIVSELPKELKTKPQIACMLSHISVERKLYKEAEHWLDVFYKNREQTENGKWKNIKDEASYADLSLSLILAKPNVFFGSKITDNLKEKIKEIINIFHKLNTDSQYNQLRLFQPNWPLRYALALELNEELDKAILTLQKGIDDFPKETYLKTQLSRLFEKTGQIAKSIEILEKLLNLESIDTKSSEKKLIDYSQMDIGKKSFPIFMVLSDLYFQNNQQGKTWELLDKVEKSPSISEDQKTKIKRYQISRFISLGRIKEAEEKFNPLFEKDKTHIINLILKSKIEKAKAKSFENKIDVFKSHTEKSIEYLKSAYSIFKDKYKDQTNKTYFEGEEWVIEIQRLVYELYNSKMYEEAESLLEEITNNNLNHPEIFKLLHVYYENGKNEQAIGLAKELFKKFPERIEPVYTLSLIYENLGDRKTAVQYYERFYEKNPNNSFIRIGLSIAYINRGDITKAREILKADFKLEQLSGEQISRLSFAYNRTENTKKALEILYKYIKNNPRELEPQKFYFDLVAFLKHRKTYHSQNPDQAIESQLDYAFLQPKTVGVDCYVQIKDIDNFNTIDVVIEKDADTYHLDHELSKALLGKKKNETIEINNEKYQILEIESKYIYTWNKIAKENKTKYPSKAFVKLFSVPQDPDINILSQTLKKIIPDFLKQQEDITKLYRFYNQGQATIGVIAKISGQHPIEVIGDLIKKNKWISAVPNWEKDQKTQEFLDTNTNILIDLSSLITIHWLEIEKYIESSPFKIFICQSTIDSLTEYINKMSLHLKDGRLTMEFDKKGDLVKDFVPSDKIKKDLNFWIKVKTWAESYCQIKPLSAEIVLSRKERQQKENLLGKEFFDSLLAVDSNFILLCEDAILRQLAKHEYSIKGVRLFDLIEHFKRHGLIDSSQAVKIEAQLVRLNQIYIPMDHHILFFLLKESEYSLNDIGFQRALHFLSPISHLQEVVSVVANFLIEVCQTATLLPYRRQMITKMVLDQTRLGREENSKIIATHVFHLVQVRTALLPILRQEIYEYIMLWLKGKGG